MPDESTVVDLLGTAVHADIAVTPGRWTVGPAFERARSESAVFAGPAEALNWIGRNLAGLRDAVRFSAAHGTEDGWQLAEALHSWYLNRGPNSERVEVYTSGLDSARESAHPLALPQMLTGLALAESGVADYVGASRHFHEALPLWHQERHELGEAAVHSGLGVICMRTQRAERAVELFQAASAIHERLGRPRGTALMSRRLGEAWGALGRHEQACERLAAAHEAFAGMGDERNAAQCLVSLGRLHLACGSHGAAETALNRAIIAHGELGSTRAEARARVALADVLSASANDASAVREQLLAALGLLPHDDQEAADIHARLDAP
ncbi:tetratricopeptide repeat protein [Sinosporangium siamense]|uniref:Tetratricopeptide repeat protein n=1 Tax=Sinosporangium siamense TaxID=1367973 RepID=A0A919RM34_9ACTN|nr:tetratricopeptide repeat protein [Sinosporangium siamense]GII94934.1 hypothetical protein Ssi02_51650 [Sinosporangium siamense]